MSFKKSKQKGFTLIELLVVIAIIALLASVVLVGLVNARRGARDTVVKSNLKELSQALSIYAQEKGDYVPANPATNDTDISDTGSDWCNEISGSWQDPLISQQIVYSKVKVPAGSKQFCYFHQMPDIPSSPAGLVFNYCSMGLACGFTGRTFANYNTCVSQQAKNADTTRDYPSAKAAIFFWLETGTSKDYALAGSNPFFSSGGNAICLQ